MMTKMKVRVWNILLISITIMLFLSGCAEIDATSEEADFVVESSSEEQKDENSDEEDLKKEDATETMFEYTYTDVNTLKYAKTSVNIRNLPSTEGEKIGALSKNESAFVTGQCVETGWYRIEYKDSVGYVSNNYLVDEKEDLVNEPVLDVSNVSGEKRNENSTIDGKQDNTQEKGDSVTVPKYEETEGDLVWVPTKGGKKYHNKSTCSKMETPMQVSKETAIANGYTACKRCY